MQLSKIELRIGGSLLHTTIKTDVTPAEIMVLQRLHGNDAVVNVRPTRIDANRSHSREYDRLANLYDNAASASAPGDESTRLLGQLFPGAMKKLPVTLEEIGMDSLGVPLEVDLDIGADDAPDPPAVQEDQPAEKADIFTAAKATT